MDPVIASSDYQPLSCFHLPYVLIARCGSLVVQWIQTYPLLHTRLLTCKSLVKYLFEPNAWSTEFLGASKQLYKHILFYLDEDLPNISPPLFQGTLFADISPRPIIALYDTMWEIHHLPIN